MVVTIGVISLVLSTSGKRLCIISNVENSSSNGSTCPKRTPLRWNQNGSGKNWAFHGGILGVKSAGLRSKVRVSLTSSGSPVRTCGDGSTRCSQSPFSSLMKITETTFRFRFQGGKGRSKNQLIFCFEVGAKITSELFALSDFISAQPLFLEKSLL